MPEFYRRGTIEIVDGNLRDVSYIAANMRQKDRVEIFAAQPMSNTEMLAASIMRACDRPGGLVHVVRRKKAPIAVIFGCTRRYALFEVGFFATSQWPRVALATTKFIRRTMIPNMLAAGYNRVTCETLASYTESHKWLECLGATCDGPLQDFGMSRETFLLYSWTRSNFENVCPGLDTGVGRGIGSAGAESDAAARAH